MIKKLNGFKNGKPAKIRVEVYNNHGNESHICYQFNYRDYDLGNRDPGKIIPQVTSPEKAREGVYDMHRKTGTTFSEAWKHSSPKSFSGILPFSSIEREYNLIAIWKIKLNTNPLLQ